MSYYYKEMSKEFQEALKVIQKYCQYEDCQEANCDECPYPLKEIRCGDE